MFNYDDQRTAEERQRDFERGERRRQQGVLARGFLSQLRKKFLTDESIEVGLVQMRWSNGGELLVRTDGVTYKLEVTVAMDDE